MVVICLVIYVLKSWQKKADKERKEEEREKQILSNLSETQKEVSKFLSNDTLKEILKKWSDVSEIVPIADKYKGGKLILEPGDTSLKAYELPIDTFFHKITMVRDRLRVMEQRINASDLDEQGKIDLQQYITRIYGSLTSFNVLFKSKNQQFVGQKTS